ncbi:hypothetical protein RSAG8_10626, partial [Rhizoctonia solani AG-8 WAC10335]
MSLDELEQADGLASLLLVVGTSIKTDGAARLVKSLAKRVHAGGGVVVYIDRAPLPDRKWGDFFDLQLQTEIDLWARDASGCLNALDERGDVKKAVTEVLQALRDRDIKQPRKSNTSLSSITSFPAACDSHLVSMTPTPSKTTDLIILVCHSGAAPFLARAVAIQLVGLGRTCGWKCHGYIVVLSGSEDDLRSVPAQKNYYLIVVHISDYLFRLRGPWRPIEPGQRVQELLQKLVCAMRALSQQGNGRLLLLICAEDELLDRDDTAHLQELFERQSTFDSMITSLNMSHFKIHGWARFALDVALSHSQTHSDLVSHIAARWMDNIELYETTDFVLFSRAQRATMFLASCFVDRPLGKPLPRIDTTCPCQPDTLTTNEKQWQVHHNAVNGCAARDVRMMAQCSACQQSWSLATTHLLGTVLCVGGNFSLQLELDRESGWV